MRIEEISSVLLLLTLFQCSQNVIQWEEIIFVSTNRIHVKILQKAVNALDNFIQNRDISAYKLISFENSAGVLYRIIFALQVSEISEVDIYSIVIKSNSELNTEYYKARSITKSQYDKIMSIHDKSYIDIHKELADYCFNKLNKIMHGVSSIYQYMNNFVIHTQIDLYDSIYIMHIALDGDISFIQLS